MSRRKATCQRCGVDIRQGSTLCRQCKRLERLAEREHVERKENSGRSE